MARAKAKRETYYQRWLRGKKKMTIILREEEYNAIKQFCDAHQMSYRQFFVEVAPKLLRENEALRNEIEGLRKALAERDGQIAELTAKYNSLAEKYKKTREELASLTEEYEDVKSEKNALTGELTQVKAELEVTKKRLSEAEARAKRAEEELSKAKEELAKTKEILGILLGGKVEVSTKYCEKLKDFGFHVGQRGFMKKEVVCTNSEELV